MRESLIAATPEDTEAVGARLALNLPSANSRALQLQLHGDLGAGKTTLARGFLHALGHSGVVRSPTYTLFETYDLREITVVHADLYRLQSPDEFEGLGLRDLAAPGHVWLIEWPQRAANWLPPADVEVTLTAHPDAHRVELEALSSLGERWLAQVRG